jgi:hypothetical protein
MTARGFEISRQKAVEALFLHQIGQKRVGAGGVNRCDEVLDKRSLQSRAGQKHAAVPGHLCRLVDKKAL